MNENAFEEALGTDQAYTDLAAYFVAERGCGRMRMQAAGLHPLEIDQAMAFAEMMHAEQLAAMARKLGLADQVTVH